jgi:dienelactone hydrolase
VRPAAVRKRDIEVGAGVRLRGTLAIPAGARGIVLFAHGSGSSRHSPRNRYVAGVLEDAGFATLLMDLLTEGEEIEDRVTRRLRFDMEFLAGRLAAAARRVHADPETSALRIGTFGASTGAGAALVAAAADPALVTAVVSRGGRPDLAGDALASVQAPTLLIVGGEDDLVIELNRQAQLRLLAETELAIVPGASHLFEEPGALEAVASLASTWFSRHLPSS